MKKGKLSNKWCWINWILMQNKNKLDPYLPAHNKTA